MRSVQVRRERRGGYIPCKRGDHAGPQEHHTGNCTSIVSIPHWASVVRPQEPLSFQLVHATNTSALSSDNLRVCDSTAEGEDTREDRADAPCELYAPRFLAFRPEEVEEECGTEDGGYVDADEDVVRGDTDKVIVVNCCPWVQGLDEVLLIDVV